MGMKVEPLKKRRRRWGKGIALVVAAAAALAAYGRLFFSAGVEVGGSFLERQPGADDPNQAVYREFPTGVSATVTGEKTDRARIVFELPGGESAAYAIETAREGDSISASILGEDGGELCREWRVDAPCAGGNKRRLCAAAGRTGDDGRRGSSDPGAVGIFSGGAASVYGLWAGYTVFGNLSSPCEWGGLEAPEAFGILYGAAKHFPYFYGVDGYFHAGPGCGVLAP